MRRDALYIFLFSFVALCCRSIQAPDRLDAAAEERMVVADSLARSMLFKDAVSAYAGIAEEFAGSRFYPDAVLKAAYLSSHPDNPAADDSTSLRWFKLYLDLQITGETRDRAAAEVTLLTRILAFKKFIQSQRAEIDSLKALSRDQGTELAVKTSRVHELELQLKQVSDELNKLRDVDVNISNRRVKK